MFDRRQIASCDMFLSHKINFDFLPDTKMNVDNACRQIGEREFLKYFWALWTLPNAKFVVKCFKGSLIDLKIKRLYLLVVTLGLPMVATLSYVL